MASTFYGGLGARVEERFTTRNGEEGKRSYTVFAEEPHGLSEGDVVNVSGLHSARVREYEKQDGSTGHAVDVVLNSPRIEKQSTDDSDSPF